MSEGIFVSSWIQRNYKKKGNSGKSEEKNAYKVKRTRRPASLEPMNPYERRIIHSALQDDKFVYTKSEGEDPFRHVVVLPKKEAIPQRRYYKSYDKGYKTNYDRSAAGTRETAEKLTSEE